MAELQRASQIGKWKPIFFPFNENLKNLNKILVKKQKLLLSIIPIIQLVNYIQKELNYIFKICRKRKIYLIVDEAYSDFVIGKKFFPVLI